ncbi:hypothetical protein DRJ22_02355 [Candidatus Woesearchaeota archaeon]|nr:MAG: hypothetical protein DRJ22_02355 [Candidatus Woesearchaeota archaeon]
MPQLTPQQQNSSAGSGVNEIPVPQDFDGSDPGDIIDVLENLMEYAAAYQQALQNQEENENQIPKPLSDEAISNILQNIANQNSNNIKPGSGNSQFFASAHYFYKKNHYKVKIRSPTFNITGTVRGKIRQFELTQIQKVTPEQFARLPKSNFDKFTKITGLAKYRYDSKIGLYEIYDYKLKEKNRKSRSAKHEGILLPENLILIKDSSGSMSEFSMNGSSTESYINSGNKADMLMKTVYGVLEEVYNTAKIMKKAKKVKVGIVDFSAKTWWSGFSKIDDFWKERETETSHLLLGQQWGGTDLDSRVFTGNSNKKYINPDGTEHKEIFKEIEKKRSVMVLITDGEFGGSTDELYNAMKKYVNFKESCLVYFGIGGLGGFGKKLKKLKSKKNNVFIEEIQTPKDALETLENVVFQYEKKRR